MAKRNSKPDHEKLRLDWIERIKNEVETVMREQDRGHEILFERLQIHDVTNAMCQAAREQVIKSLLSGLAIAATARDYDYIASRSLLIHAMARQINHDRRHPPF